ncbi:Multi antimicrobial extrusion protein [Parasponia andersonii]|uniref:Protein DETOXIFICATION n=1 Tax=Parasponia andersonii TaxID=3476 RepID=A0A2P5B128_PARAD|nr:Multi antimicrobial extrusion protein [Parasponia andersonii]
MASSLSQRLVCIHSHPVSKSRSIIRNPICSVRLPTPPKSSPRNSSTASSQEPQLKVTPQTQNDEPPPPPSFSDSLSIRLRRLSDGIFKFDDLLREILSIALPAALSLAADPVTSLVDTAFVGHIGSAELAAVGVSVTVFNLIAKFFNVPLLNVTTSFVAEEQASVNKGSENSSQIGDDFQEERQSKKYLPSVSTSLSLAAIIGIAETVALFFGSGSIMNIMGIPVDSPMWVPAQQFLTLRAFGAPPIVIALAAQGTFRGFMDTKTPLYAVVAGNVLNAILDPILIFSFGLGIEGAAIATVISEYLTAFILLWKLSGKILLIPAKIDGRRITSYLTSGGLLIGRTVAVLTTTTLATSMAAQEGPVRMAGFQICFEVWLAISLLTDALALAGQALLANGYSQKDYEQSRRVIYRVLQIGLIMGFTLAIVLFLGFGAFSSLFTPDSEVSDVAWSGLWFVAGSQPMNALAFVIDGLYYGVSDFGYAAYSMVLAGLVSSIFILVAAPAFGLTGVWAGLFLFMTLRVVAGIWRLGMKSGPWEMVWDTRELESK